MKVDITSLVGGIPISDRNAVRYAINRAVSYFGLTAVGELSVVFLSSRQIKKINNQYLKKNRPTTTLSFPTLSLKPSRSYAVQLKKLVYGKSVMHFGEIFLCPTEIRKYAKKTGLLYTKALQHLSLHSFLHCLGYKHDTTRSENKMESAANKILV